MRFDTVLSRPVGAEPSPAGGIDGSTAACQAMVAMCKRALAILTALLLATPATARVWRVCNGSSHPCPPGTAFKTISSAVLRAGPGDWVLVWPGVYHEGGIQQGPVCLFNAKGNLVLQNQLIPRRC